jgi:NAD(P)H-nitrite reductase large subunit
MKKDLLGKGAILQRDKETYAIAPHIPGGITDTATLRKICDVADKYRVQAIKITSAQRIALIGIKEEELDDIWADLGQTPGAVIGLCVRSIKICPGTTYCKRGVQDSIGLGLKLTAAYHAMELPSKMKMGVAGCRLSCAEVWVKDIGVIGTLKGWNIVVGGTAGVRPRLADVLVEEVASQEEVLAIVERIVNYYKANPKKERIGRIVEEIGIEKFHEAVLGKPQASCVIESDKTTGAIR